MEDILKIEKESTKSPNKLFKCIEIGLYHCG